MSEKGISQETVRKLFRYDPESGDLIRKVRTSNRVKVGDVAGNPKYNGYVQVSVEGKGYWAHRLVFLYHHGFLPENGFDHIDRDPSNNRIDNLREASHSCNMRNTGNRVNNSSGVKGVSWEKATGKWRAKIIAKGKQIHLGLHNDLTEAVAHRLAAEQAEGWSGCDSSSPAYLHIQQYTAGSLER